MASPFPRAFDGDVSNLREVGLEQRHVGLTQAILVEEIDVPRGRHLLAAVLGRIEAVEPKDKGGYRERQLRREVGRVDQHLVVHVLHRREWCDTLQ